MLRKSQATLQLTQRPQPSKLNERHSRFLHASLARAWRIKEALRDLVRDKDEATVTRAKPNKLTSGSSVAAWNTC
jgi:hypothetical protein